jgi:hypothetical protein
MKKLWFVCHNRLVQGPFTTQEVENALALGTYSNESLVWWKGQLNWLSIAQWKKDLALILRSLEDKPKELATWYFHIESETKGPFTREELLIQLSKQKNPTQCRVWSPGMSTWQGLYEFNDFIKALGMSPRAYPRIPLTGVVEVDDTLNRLSAALDCIGIGGLGLRDAKFLVAGQELNVVIRSPQLVDPIYTPVDVLYVKKDGSAGLKFKQLHSEAQSHIIDLVREFRLGRITKKAS